MTSFSSIFCSSMGLKTARGTQMEGSFHVLKNAYMKRATKEFLRMLCENRSYGLALMNLL